MRRLLLICLILSLMAAGVYQFSSAGMEKSLQSFCRRCLKSELHYQKFTFENSTLTIDRPCLSKLKESAPFFSAGQIVIHYVKWLDFRIVVAEPELELIEAFKELNLLWQVFHGKIDVVKGKLFLPGGEFCLFDLHAEKEAKGDSCGRLNLSFGSGQMSLSSSDGNAKLLFQEFNPKAIAPLIHYTFPETRHWEVEAGAMNGALEMKGGLTQGEIQLSGLKMGNRQLQCQGVFPEGTLLVNTAHSVPAKWKSQGGSLSFNRASLNALSLDLSPAEFSLEGELEEIPFKVDGVFNENSLHFVADFAHCPDAKLKGEIVFGQPVLTLLYSGPSDPLKPYMPLVEDPLFALAQIKKTDAGFTVDGSVDLQSDRCRFGFELAKRGLEVQNGWFHAKGLPVEKYLAPFIFQDKHTQVHGKADVKGAFDSRKLDLSYHLHYLTLDTPCLFLEAKGFKEAALHRFDFLQHTHRGVLPIAEASCLEKSQGLMLTGISTLARLEGHKIHFGDLEAKWKGIAFLGSIDFDYDLSGEKAYDIEIHAHTMQASALELQQFLAHFKNPLKLPLQGQVNLQGSGASIRLTCWPAHFQMEGSVQGAFNQIAYENRLTGVSADFDYRFNGDQSTCDLTQIKGLLFQEYPLTGGRIHLAQNKAHFDLALGDLRLCGQTAPLGENRVSIELDREKSRFGEIRPAAFTLILKDWSEIDQFQMETEFSLQSLKQINPDLKNLAAEGDFKLHLGFEKEALTYRLTGQNISVGDTRFQNCSLAGRKTHAAWTIDQGELDALSFSADLARHPSSWKIDFLGVRYKDALLMGIEGEYFNLSHHLEGKVNLLEADLGKLSDIKGAIFINSSLDSDERGKAAAGRIPDEFVKVAAKGILRADGPFTLEFSKLAPRWKLDAQLSGSLHQWGIQDLQFADNDNLFCHIRSDRGVTLRGLEGVAPEITFQIDKIDYDINQKELEIEALDFHAPKADWLIDKLQSYFPAYPLYLAKKKLNGEIKGSLSGLKSPDDYHVELSLEQDQFTLEIDPDGFQCRAALAYEQQTFLLLCRATFTNSSGIRPAAALLSTGQLFINDSLTLDWSFEENKGFTIERAEGSCSGLTLHLARTAADLTGEIRASLPQALCWIPSSFKELCAFGKNDFVLKGKFGASAFDGTVEGRTIELNGRPFQHLSCEVHSDQESISIQNFHADNLYAPHMVLEKKGGDWKASVPSFSASDIKPCKSWPLVIKQMEAENLSGTLQNPFSYTGKGKFTFANGAKKNLPSTFLTLPGEISNRLEMTALTPFKGTVHYEIKEGKIYFTKFEEVYSEGKVSKFYLPGGDSYMDFNGSLHVKLGMKQCGHLFKFTEPLTFLLEGPYDKPSFSLIPQKQKFSL